jgi:hypothetical protein
MQSPLSIATTSIATLSRYGSQLAAHAQTDRGVLHLYTATIFTSAFLLFAVQPIFAKMVLPSLGGSPSVWAVSMCFFQAVLLAGYCYAHAMNRFVPVQHAPLVHVGLLVVALFALPFGLPSGATPPADGAYLWLIGTLAVGVGLPFFAVSANAPLLQSWFSRTGHPHAADPYFLYAASNVGSLLALLSYPIVVEPMLGLATQAQIWTAVFVMLAMMIAASGAVMLVLHQGLANRRASDTADSIARDTAATPVEVLTWSQRLVWIGLSLVPSGLLCAYTTHVTTDIASVPLLWVVPLAAFLGTFIVAFRDQPLVPDHFLTKSIAPLVAFCVLSYIVPASSSVGLIIALTFTAFLVVTTLCHRELYRRRPSAAHLTEFYLWMSFGGVLGGMLASIVAPQIFNTVAEYPMLFVAGLLGQAALWQRPDEEEHGKLVLIGATTLLTLVVCFAGSQLLVPAVSNKALLFALVAALTFAAIWHSRPQRSTIVIVGALIAVLWVPRGFAVMTIERSFFGVIKVSEDDTGEMRLMSHGTTLHGAERIRTADGKPVEWPVPATYYHPKGAMARGIDIARSARASQGGIAVPFDVGVVGLGVGSMSCYAQPTEKWRFYEIDPLVVEIAKNPKYFSFLSKCPLSDGIVLGDARLTLQKEPRGRFDYLVIDAFSSDAVPVHLITREAIAMYLDRVEPHGLLAMHVSSRFMDLENVAVATARTLPGVEAAIVTTPAGNGMDATYSAVVFLSRSKETIAKVRAMPESQPLPTQKIAPWTDDYSDIVGAIRRHWARAKNRE